MTALGWLDDAQQTYLHATRRQSLGRATASAVCLVLVGVAVVSTAVIVWPLELGAPVKALLLLTPVAVSEAIAPLTDAMQALARARGSEARLSGLLGRDPAVVAPPTRPAPSTGIDPSTRPDTGAGSDPESPPRSGRSVPPRLVARGLTAAWPGGPVALGPVDLDIPAGSRVALTGPNGSGKSTLVSVIARHLDPVDGTLTWDDTPVTDLPADVVRSQVAVVDDEPHVFAGTLRANLLLASPAATDRDVEDALAGAGLAPLLAELPAGLDTRIGEGGRGLSGGERARLGIARALLSQRPVVLLDEPVAHLDPPTAHAVLQDLLATTDAAPGASRTIVMATHRIEDLDLFDQVLTLQHRPE
jgi:ABC-type transport system involved in cytochrome bd biosynthesis fused ATPase/permease subunit